MIDTLNIYFSDACNGQCTYCAMSNINTSNNNAIRAALSSGTFVRNTLNNLTPSVKTLGIWGREPSINGSYFKDFIYTILDNNKTLRYVFIPTNGQSPLFYEDFIKPLYHYCVKNARKLILIIQLSLDGPKELHDKYCGEGSFDKVIALVSSIYKKLPQSNFFRVRIINKSTLRGPELITYSPSYWHDSMWELHDSFHIDDPDFMLGTIGPTLELPGQYTTQEGKALIKWKGILNISSIPCRAGVEGKTLNYKGELFDCNLLVNNKLDLNKLQIDFENKMNQLVIKGEVQEQDRDILFRKIMNLYCWGQTTDNTMPESYIRLLGNGFLL